MLVLWAVLHAAILHLNFLKNKYRNKLMDKNHEVALQLAEEELPVSMSQFSKPPQIEVITFYPCLALNCKLISHLYRFVLRVKTYMF
jgi:hypothetical protein